MSNLSLSENQQSPFDSIKRTENDGTEYWLATELLAMLGYKSWKRQKETVDRAILSAKNSGENVDSHFADVVQMVQIGNSSAFREVLKDFKLSRYAAYLTAQNGDPRKPEIAMAQSYFATKTREAEIIVPKQNDRIRELELANENMRLMLQWSTKQDNRIALHGLPIAMMLEGKSDAVVEVEKPTIEVFDDRDGQQVKYVGQTCAQLKDYMKSRYGINFTSGTNVKKTLQAIESETGESLLASTPRKIITDYIPSEFSDKAIAYLRDAKNWQMLIGQ